MALAVTELVTSTLRAQAPAVGDPFVKEPGVAPAFDGPKPPGKGKTWRNCLCILEVYTLAKKDIPSVLDAETGNAARYRGVLDLGKAGKARLETLMALATKSGQRAVSEAVDEVRYVSEYVPSKYPGGLPVPKSIETRNAGDIFEFEPVLSADGRTCSMNLRPARVALLAFRDHGFPGGKFTAQPVFDARKIATSVNIPVGEPYFLGTFSSADDTPPAPEKPEREISLAFLRVQVQQPAAAELTKGVSTANWPAVGLEYSVYSLDRAAARDLLAEASTLDAPWEKVKSLLDGDQARIESVHSVSTAPGQRAVLEDIRENRYPSEFTEAAPVTDKEAQTKSSAEENDPFIPTAFDIRVSGQSFEVEPVISPDGRSVDLNNVASIVYYRGNLKITGAQARPPQSPLFTSQKFTTSLTMLAARKTLIGTISPPSPDGTNDRTDDGRTWLVFVRALPGER